MTRSAKSVRMTASADVESVWVSYRCGTVSSVVLMRKDGSTCDLRGAPMWRWLKEWSQQWRGPKTMSPNDSRQASLAFANEERASGLATTPRRTRR